jgi:Got1/Sft2-like family
MMALSDNTKLGVTMTALGCLFLFFGVILFFDSGLLTIGNILLLAGIPFIIGWQRTLLFFNPIKRRERAAGIFLFFGGVFLVLIRWTFIGMAIELYGIANLFGNFLPSIVDTLRLVPYVGPLMNSRAITWLVDKVRSGSRRRPPV